MKLRQTLISGAGAVLLGLASLPANAAPIENLLVDGLNDFSDNSAEELIDNTVTVAGQIDVGDVLSGIATIGTIEDTNIGEGTIYNELTAYFQIEVLSVTANNAGGAATCVTAAYCYTFGPSAAFATELESDFGVTDATGAMVLFFQDSTPNYLRETSTATGYANATDGSLQWLYGISDADDYWTATATGNNIGVASILGPTTAFGTFQIALTLLENYSPITFREVTCQALAHDGVGDGFGITTTTNDICGQGQLLGVNGENTGFDSYDDVNFVVNVVPEPATIGIFGLGLLGLGLVGRRRRRTA